MISLRRFFRALTEPKTLIRIFGAKLLGRFIILNILGLASFAGGFLLLSEARQTLINAYAESLKVQAGIIAGALSQAVNERDFEFIAPQLLDQAITDGWQVREATRILQRIGYSTPVRVRLYGRNGLLILDSVTLNNNSDVLSYPLTPLEEGRSFWQRFQIALKGQRPMLNEIIAANGAQITEVNAALAGESGAGLYYSSQGEDVLVYASPVQGYRTTIGALMVSTPPGLIDAIVAQERGNVFDLSIIALVVSFATSLAMAASVIFPIRTLASSMRQFGRSFDRSLTSLSASDAIPDYSERNDEIAYLATTLREMTARLVDRIHAIDGFAADVAHELKNPLTSLHSAVQTLPRTDDEAIRARLTEIIENDVQRLNHLISDISRASRLDAELGVSAGKRFDLAELARTISEPLAELYKSRADVSLVVSASEPCFVYAHPQRVAQIITNLLSNALSLSPKGGRIFLTCDVVEQNGRLIIADEGPGIRAGMEERIFERFYRDRPQDSSGADGEARIADLGVATLHSGLGLSISRQIARAYQGELVGANRPDGKGAFFTLTLPRRAQNDFA